MECFRLLFHHLAWIEHQFLNGIRDSKKAGSLWGMLRALGGIRKSIDQSWLAKGLGLGLGLLCWGFRGVQEEIPLEEASTLQIGSVAFSLGLCTSPQLYPCHWLFDQYASPWSLYIYIYIYWQQLWTDTGFSMEDLLRAMDYRDEWWERVREIRASGRP